MNEIQITLTENEWQQVIGALFNHPAPESPELGEKIHVQLWGQPSNFKHNPDEMTNCFAQQTSDELQPDGCDNCGSGAHHTEECIYSFGCNPQ